MLPIVTLERQPSTIERGRAGDGLDVVGGASGALTDRNVELPVPMPAVELGLIGR
jgi:hypothetical protein